MMIVNKLKICTAVLGVAAAVTSAFVWGDAPIGQTPAGGGLNPNGVKLSDNVMSGRFSKAPVVTYQTHDGDTIFALQLKPALKPAAVRPRDLVVVIDTSASQAGKFLDASRKILDQLIRDASPADRLSLWVINTPRATRRLSKGLEYAGNRDNTASMLRALEDEYPSGAVDLKNGLSNDNILKDFDGKVSRQQIVVYLGDAESAFARLSEKDRYQLANKVRESKVQLFAVPLGTAINGMNMHSLVTGTGGSVVRFSDDIRDSKELYKDLSRRLFEAFQVPVLMSSKLTFACAVEEFYPKTLPPLRSDTPTLVVGRFAKGKVPAKLEGTIEGRLGQTDAKTTFGEVVPAASVDNFFLTTILRQWSESDLKEAPAVLRADRTLALAYEQGRMTRDEYLTQAQWALGANKFETAKNLSEAASKIDPDNAEVKALDKIIDKLDKGKMTLEQLHAATRQQMGVHYQKAADGTMTQVRVALADIADEPAPKPAPPVQTGNPTDLLKLEQARKAILEQQANLTVQDTLARARELLRAGDPKAAKDLVLAQRDSIKGNPDIGDALRTQLLNRMELLLTDIGQRGEIILRAKADESEKIARARANLMTADVQQANQERIRSRVEAFTNLMKQARFEDAYRESLVMIQDETNHGQPVTLATQAVYQMGQAATNLREMRELTRIREDRFLLTMMQVEKSAIPYPDEPPVHFPPSKVWRNLLETRKRYATNDFEGDMPPRTRKRMEFLQSALENPIPEIEQGELQLPFLLNTLQDLASPPGAARDPSRKVTILLAVDAFTKEKPDMPFDPEKKTIKFSTKLTGVSLSTVLRLICDQLNATYWVRRDYIEIVPAEMAIREKVTRVFPVGDLIIGIPNAVNQSALNQSISVMGATFSLGGGLTGAPVVFNGNAGGLMGGIQFVGGGIGGIQAGGGQGQQFGGFGAGAAGGLFNGGCNGGIRGFGGGIQGQFGNLGGQFGFQGQDYGPVLTQLITEVVAKGEWSTPQNLFCAGGGGGQAGNVDPALDAMATQLPADQLNSMGYWPPARALIIRGTSRIHRTGSSKLNLNKMAAANFQGGDPNVVGQIGGDVVKADPKDGPKADPKAVAAELLEKKCDEIVKGIVAKEKNLDPEKIYQMLLDKGMTEPGEIIACADFMVKCKQFKHAAELLKASLRSGVIAEPWAQEALAIALEGSQGSPEEIERARVSAIDLAPKSSLAYVKAAKAMADMGQMDRAMTFCREAARLEPSSADPYINALAFASDKKATLDAGVSAWAAGNLLGRDWTTDTAEYHLRAREHLKEQMVKFVSQNKKAEMQAVQAVLDNEKRRDLVIELLWSGPADLDLKVREPIGTVCSTLERQSAGGGVFLCDDFTQKDDSRRATYKASEAFNGSYQVTVDRVWGRPLGNKALLKVTRHLGTPEQTVEIYPIDLAKQPSLALTFDGGRRSTLASVPPPAAAPDAVRKPEREQEAMNKLRAMTSGGSPGMSGGTGSATQRTRGAQDAFDSPLVELSQQTSIASLAPGGLEIRQQTTMSKDGKKVQVKMAPVFETAVAAKGAKLKLDFIPGAE